MSDPSSAMRVFTVYDKGTQSVVLGQGACFPSGVTVVQWAGVEWGIEVWPTLELLDASRPDLFILVHDVNLLVWK